jgi:hypothetical protein
MGDAGVSALCDGLFANSVLKVRGSLARFVWCSASTPSSPRGNVWPQHLHLDYCGIGQAGAVKLAQLVSIPASAVETLSLQGNVLRDAGLLDLSLGLARSQRLVKLNIADNGIRHVRCPLLRILALVTDLVMNHRTPRRLAPSATRSCAARRSRMST